MATKSLSLQEKFDATSESMQERVFERLDLIEAILNGFVSGTNVFVLGAPGEGKTYTFNLIRQHIGDLQLGDWFTKMMTRYTTPPEVFGALDVAAMDEGIHRHVVDYRSIIVAKLAFIDEIWKISSSMANAFLSVFNERVFFNDVPIQMDLIMTGAGSNELPQGEGLEAIYDRFGFRVHTQPLRSKSSKRRLLESHLAAAVPITPTLELQDIYTAQKEAESVEVSTDVLDALIQLQDDLRGAGLQPTDRRTFGNTLPVIRASAWRRGAQVAEIQDMRQLSLMFWDKPADKTIADQFVLGLAAPFDAEALKLRTEVDKLADEMATIIANSDNDVQRTQTAVSLHGKVKKAEAEVKALKARADRPSQIISNLHREVRDLNRRMLRDLLLVDPDEVLNDQDDD